jgi:chromosome segregation ATPase
MEQPTAKDLEAHLQVIKGNVRIANKELEEALEARDIALACLPVIESQKLSLQSDVAKLQGDITELEGIIKTKTAKSEFLDDEYTTKLEALKKEEKRLAARVDALNETIKKTEERIEKLEARIISRLEKLVTLDESIKQSKANEKESRKNEDIARKAARVEEQRLSELSASVVEKQKELEAIEEQIREAQRNVETPLKSLAEKERLFEQKQRDFKVLKTRLQRKWAEIYPGKTFILD